MSARKDTAGGMVLQAALDLFDAVPKATETAEPAPAYESAETYEVVIPHGETAAELEQAAVELQAAQAELAEKSKSKEAQTAERIAALRTQYRDFEIRKPDPSVKRPGLERGWLLQYLFGADEITWRRWTHWAELSMYGGIGDEPIPQVQWLESGDKRTRKMIENALDSVTLWGGWAGWTGSEYLRYFLEWLLYGFGDSSQPEIPKEPAGCEGSSDRLYQTVNLGPWMLWPYDYLGDILSENNYGKGQGFYPTPMAICKVMTGMTFGAMEGEDLRAKTVYDPCIGTGRFPLIASNYSYRLYGTDIDPLTVAATRVNAWLYAPWMAKPFWFFSEKCTEQEEQGNLQARNALTQPLLMAAAG